MLLLQEEMRRTLRYLEWQAAWWDERVDSRPAATAQVRAGVRAYAKKQAWEHRRLAAHFKSVWEKNVIDNTEVVMEGADLAQFFTQSESVVSI